MVKFSQFFMAKLALNFDTGLWQSSCVVACDSGYGRTVTAPFAVTVVIRDPCRCVWGLSVQGKVVVGHAVHNDFKVIGIRHPEMNVRDTVKCRLLRERSELPGPAVALRRLAKTLLGW